MIETLVTLSPLILTIALLFLGVPIFVGLGLGVILFLNVQAQYSLTLFSENLFSSLASFPLIAVPVFILVGDIIADTGMTKKLFDFAGSIFGGLKTSMGTITLAACGLFSMISGSNVADAATIGRMTLNPLQSEGYSLSYSSALVAAGGATGILIPPSIMYIIAGTVLNVSVSDLFLASLLPGVLILLSIIAANIVVNNIMDYESGGSFNGFDEVIRSFWEAKFALLIPIIILGGIYSGIFTPTESAAVAVFAALFITMAQGTLTIANMPTMLERSALITGILSPNIALGLILADVFAAYRIPLLLVTSLTGLIASNTAMILIIALSLLITGMILPVAPSIIIFGPLLMPLAVEFGMDPVHFVVFFVSALGVGFITPPIGMNLFVISGISGAPLLSVGKKALPFTLAMIIVVLAIGFIPEISLIFL